MVERDEEASVADWDVTRHAALSVRERARRLSLFRTIGAFASRDRTARGNSIAHPVIGPRKKSRAIAIAGFQVDHTMRWTRLPDEDITRKIPSAKTDRLRHYLGPLLTAPPIATRNHPHAGCDAGPHGRRLGDTDLIAIVAEIQ